jgi:hypothetical protein
MSKWYSDLGGKRKSHTKEDVLETFYEQIKWFTPDFSPPEFIKMDNEESVL